MKLNIRPFLFYLSLFSFALLYIFGRFQGLETHSGYYGFSYKILHPESFYGDPYSNFHIAMISLYSLLVKLVGELWLDDRFIFFIGILLASLSLWGLVKISQLLGIQNKVLLLGVTAILLVDHQIVDNVPYIVDRFCFRPSNFAAPIGIWIIYFFLKGSLRGVLLTLACLLAFSFKNGWFPSLVISLLFLRERLDIRWLKIAFGFVLMMGFFFGIHYLWRLKTGTLDFNVVFFDDTRVHMENSEANPFLDRYAQFFYLALLAVTFFFSRFSNPVIEKRIRAVCLISALVFVLGGAYYTWTPNALKVPFFLAMAVNRSTWWPQIFAFTVLACSLLLMLNSAFGGKKILLSLALLVLFFYPIVEYPFIRDFSLEHPPFFEGKIFKFKAMFFLLIGMNFLYFFFLKKRKADCIPFSHVIIIPMIATMALHLAGKSYQRKDHLLFLLQHGIAGDSPGAKWIGLNEFFKKETDIKSTVWSLSGDPELRVDPSLKVRSGKTMLYGDKITHYFDFEARRNDDKIYKVAEQFLKDWKECNPGNIGKDLDSLNNPDYLVVPTSKICDVTTIGYTFVREINSFSIFKRDSFTS